MANSMTRLDDAEPLGLRPLSGLFLAVGVGFFPLIMNPLIFDYFDAADDAERLAHVEEHHTALRLIFTGIGITELALGIAVRLWAVHVAARTAGRRARVAGWLGRVALVAGVVGLGVRLMVWVDDAESLATDDLGAFDILFGLIYGGGFSLAFLVFGYFMIRGAMPTWLGVIWMLCGVMFWVGILPLWFFVGAMVFGIRGLIAFRPGSPALDRVSADSIQPAAEEAATTTEVQQ